MYPLSSNMSFGSGFLLIWMIIHLPFSTACLEDERSYLLDFKAGLNLSSARSLSSWRGFNCCQWEGVSCDYHTSHVIYLHLNSHPDDSYRTRELRPSLFNLQHLHQLDLSGNDFQGISITPLFSKLHRLTSLSLSNTGFHGEVPLELGNMSSLRHFDISDNYQMTSSKFDVWVRKLRSLEFLGMKGVNLTMASEHWGEALSSLPNLTQIHLSSCGFSGNIPDLSNLTRLSHLHLRDNSFPFDLPSWFENVSSLVSLDLNACGLHGSIPSNFMAHSRMSNLVLSYNVDLKGNLFFIMNHSSSLVVLSLQGCNLGGVFPPTIANFSKLMIMDLSDNNLKGYIPSSFGSFSSINYLDLSSNRLSGHIPLSLCQLPNLSKLILDHNQLSGRIPDTIPNLEVLSLSSNQLIGKLSLQVLENVTHLRHLQLSGNQLSISISTSWVPQFANLESLGLRSCNIEGELPAFLSQQYQLIELDLSYNNIVGKLPSWLWDLPNLQHLNLSNNELEGCLPHKISHGFEVVDLHGNRLYGSLPALNFVSGILDLSENGFNGSIPATTGTPLFLSLSGNNLSGQIPSSICTGLDSYEVLDLSKNKLIGMIPVNIGRCSALAVLRLAQNVLEGEIPKELGNLMALHTLNLKSNMLQGIIPSSIANCTNLCVFDLGNNKFEGSIPVWIENLTQLRILSLASNKFADRIPTQLFRMQNLQILDLHGNQLLGNIPPDVSKLYAMVNNSESFDIQYYSSSSLSHASYGFKIYDEVTVWIKGREILYKKIFAVDRFMDLSCNKLSGNIPPELGLLRGLISLNISRNDLGGSIPESLGAVAYLESLDLSQNKLSGKIPSQFLNLIFLQVFNLSYNMLSGTIPQGKQFSTFEASSFLGNSHLHGPPRENLTLSFGLGTPGSHKDLHNTITEDEDENADEDVMDQWWAVGFGLSYGVGFAIVISVLCFHIKWRCICFFLMDNLIHS